MRIAAILLAAGEGRRMGGPKALLPIHGTTFLGHLCRTFADAGVELTVAVLGAAWEGVSEHARIPEGVHVVVNEGWRDGMLSSLWRGLDAADRLGMDAVLVHPVDSPLVERSTIAAVLAATRQGARIAVPVHDGRRGHPAGFTRATWTALRGAAAGVGARQVLLQHPAWVVHVPAGPDCLVDLDRQEDLARLRPPASQD